VQTPASREIRDGDQLLLTASGVFKFIAAR
jgi:hypothetical protein